MTEKTDLTTDQKTDPSQVVVKRLIVLSQKLLMLLLEPRKKTQTNLR